MLSYPFLLIITETSANSCTVGADILSRVLVTNANRFAFIIHTKHTHAIVKALTIIKAYFTISLGRIVFSIHDRRVIQRRQVLIRICWWCVDLHAQIIFSAKAFVRAQSKQWAHHVWAVCHVRHVIHNVINWCAQLVCNILFTLVSAQSIGVAHREECVWKIVRLDGSKVDVLHHFLANRAVLANVCATLVDLANLPSTRIYGVPAGYGIIARVIAHFTVIFDGSAASSKKARSYPSSLQKPPEGAACLQPSPIGTFLVILFFIILLLQGTKALVHAE